MHVRFGRLSPRARVRNLGLLRGDWDVCTRTGHQYIRPYSQQGQYVRRQMPYACIPQISSSSLLLDPLLEKKRKKIEGETNKTLFSFRRPSSRPACCVTKLARPCHHCRSCSCCVWIRCLIRCIATSFVAMNFVTCLRAGGHVVMAEELGTACGGGFFCCCCCCLGTILLGGGRWRV